MGLMNRVVNPVVRLLLKTPLYRLMPGLMLITVTGRRSGRRYTTPVQYALGRDRVYVLTRADRSWWHNARDGAPIEVRLQGRTRAGTAEAFPIGDERAEQTLAAFRGTSLERGVSRFGDQAVVVAIDVDWERGGG